MTTTGGTLKLQEGTGDGDAVGFKAPDTGVTGEVVWTLPTSDGAAGQTMVTNGNKQLSWASAGLSTDGAAAGQVLAFNGTSVVWVSGIFPALSFSSISAQDLTVGVAMTTLDLDQSRTGGLTPVTYATHSGTLPSGLSLSSSGVLTGTPAVDSNTSSPYAVTVRATDHVGQTADISITIIVAIAYVEAVFAAQAVVNQELYEQIFSSGKLKFGQSFTTGISGNVISKITLPFTAYAPSGNAGIPLTCEIWTTSAGLPVAKVAGSVASGEVTVYPNDAFGYKNFTFSTPVALDPSTMYAFVIGNGPDTGYLRTYYKGDNLFSNGTMLVSNYTGTVWSMPGIPGGSLDLAFTIYELVL